MISINFYAMMKLTLDSSLLFNASYLPILPLQGDYGVGHHYGFSWISWIIDISLWIAQFLILPLGVRCLAHVTAHSTYLKGLILCLTVYVVSRRRDSCPSYFRLLKQISHYWIKNYVKSDALSAQMISARTKSINNSMVIYSSRLLFDCWWIWWLGMLLT